MSRRLLATANDAGSPVRDRRRDYACMTDSTKFLSRSNTGCSASWRMFCRASLLPVVSVAAFHCVPSSSSLPRLFAITTDSRAQRTGPNPKSLRPEPRRAVRLPAARRRRHQGADQGRHRPARGGQGRALPRAGGAGRAGACWFMPCCPSAATWSRLISTPGCCFSSRWARRPNSRCSWPVGRAATSTRCSARCAPSRK